MGTRHDIPDEDFKSHRIQVRKQAGDAVRKALEATNTEGIELARRIGMHKSHVSRVLSSTSPFAVERPIRIEFLADMARALGYIMEIKFTRIRPDSNERA